MNRIIDTHFHLWNLDENYYPWLSDGDRPTSVKNFASLRRNYLVSDLLADFGGLNVIAGVHIQAEHDHADTVRETRWLQRVADDPASRGFPHCIVADADFLATDIDEVLGRHRAYPNVRGIRHVLNRRLGHPKPYDPLDDPLWRRNFSLLRKHGLSFDMQLSPGQAEAAARLVAANPDIQFIVTHAGMPRWSDAEGADRWRRAITAYAGFPNVAMKISGFGGHDAGWNAETIRPVVAHVLDAFTPRRCMLGSNYPVERLAKPYVEVWNAFRQLFSDLTPNERDMLFWRNAARFYRIDLAALPSAGPDRPAAAA